MTSNEILAIARAAKWNHLSLGDMEAMRLNQTEFRGYAWHGTYHHLELIADVHDDRVDIEVYDSFYLCGRSTIRPRTFARCVSPRVRTRNRCNHVWILCADRRPVIGGVFGSPLAAMSRGACNELLRDREMNGDAFPFEHVVRISRKTWEEMRRRNYPSVQHLQESSGPLSAIMACHQPARGKAVL